MFGSILGLIVLCFMIIGCVVCVCKIRNPEHINPDMAIVMMETQETPKWETQKQKKLLFKQSKTQTQTTILGTGDDRKTSVSSTNKVTEETIETDEEFHEEELADIKMDPTPAEKLLQGYYDKPPSYSN